MRILYPKLRNMVHVLSLSDLIAFKGTNLSILFTTTTAGVLLCGGPKKSTRTSSIVQITFYFCPLRSLGFFENLKVTFMSRSIN